ncbi:MAG: alanine--tRNA ligase-related protein [Chitinophagaceae bacterium]
MMTSQEIRSAFFSFFQSKGHRIVPSAPIVVKNDPTLMFTNAGMNQFKDYFLGNRVAPYPRIADTQKCLRVSGKHNDLEEVGVDTYHHTMFEMLGNWSFGDYFKKEAIEWSWELLTTVLKIPKDRLYVSIFEGDEKEGLPKDDEAATEWKKWISEDRIVLGNKKDNFWEMGDTGPCGPCTEIHIDTRSEEERKIIDGKALVNADHPQVIEIWNNVFIQYNRLKDGSLQQLPARHVDTGMGFERLVRVLQGKQSNYDTDIFSGTIRKIEEITTPSVPQGGIIHPQPLLFEEVDNYKETLQGKVGALDNPPPEADTGAVTFAMLLEMVALISPELRIRFSTSHPKDITDEVLFTMAKYDNICKYIHLPLQSGSNRILQLMNRGYTREWYMAKVDRILEVMPGCGISADIIAGFCTETEEDHQETLEVMKYSKYDMSYMFFYSERPGTLAQRRFKDDISEETKKRRLQQIVDLQNKLSQESNKEDVGKTFTVLIEGNSKKREYDWMGRTSHNKVIVFPKGNHSLVAGNYVEVKVNHCTQATLLGEIV